MTEDQAAIVENEDEDLANDLPGVDELAVLKGRARMMGIVFSNNIGLPALRLKVAAKQAEAEEVLEEELVVNALTGEDPSKPKQTLREKLISEQMKLVRLRITCMDSKKKDLPGEIFTVANEYLGTVRKFVPFGEVTDNGYHVPYCIYTMLKDRKFLNIRTVKSANGKVRVEHNMAKEFALEILDPLTPTELAALANAQAAAGTFTQPND